MQRRQRGFAVALCLCLLSVSGIYGVYRYQSGQAAQEPEEQVAEAEDIREEPETETANSEGTVAQADTEEKETEEAKIETEEDIYEIGEATLAETETDSVIAQASAEGTPEEENTDGTEEAAEETLAGESLLTFAADGTLMWPVDGKVILEYSMDKSIYFPTLNQYKYHPALVISAGVGDEVWSVAQGIVSAIEVNEETGTTLTMTLGGGYEAIYGQLKELAVKEGDMVGAGSLIGYISEPTKYYTREGSNLYFQLLRDG